MVKFWIVQQYYGIALLALILSFSGNLLALECDRRFGYDESAGSQLAQAETVAQRFGSADVVVLGKIQQLATTKINGFWSSSVRAVVEVERVFKGEAKGTVEMYVDHTVKTGQRAVFYGTLETAEQVRDRKAALLQSNTVRGPESSPNPALRADGACSHEFRVIEMDAHDGSQELKHLANMPPAGSGGALRLNINVSNPNEWLPNQPRGLQRVPVTISASGKKYSAVTDAQGSVKFTKLPAGTYVLSVPKVPGFETRSVVPHAHPCDKLKVFDRGFLGTIVEYSGSASMGITINTAGGRKVDAIGLFKLTRLDVPRRIAGQPFLSPRSFLFSIEDWHQRHVAVPPGKYRLELVITQNKTVATNDYRGYEMREVARQVLESPALGVVNLREGDNNVVFTLPSKVVPALLTYKISYPSPQTKIAPYYSLTLVQKNARGSFDLNIRPKAQVSDDQRSVSFTVLSGQTWRVFAHDTAPNQRGLSVEETNVVWVDTTIALKMKEKPLSPYNP